MKSTKAIMNTVLLATLAATSAADKVEEKPTELDPKKMHKYASKETNEFEVVVTPDSSAKIFVGFDYGCPGLYYKKQGEDPRKVGRFPWPRNYDVSDDGRFVAWVSYNGFGEYPEVSVVDMNTKHTLGNYHNDPIENNLAKNISGDGSILNLAPTFTDTDGDGKDDHLAWLTMSRKKPLLEKCPIDKLFTKKDQNYHNKAPKK